MKPSARLLAVAACLSLALVGSACASDAESNASTDESTTTAAVNSAPVTIGALLDLSGDGKTLGVASKTALETAVADANEAGAKVTLEVRDTASDPATAQKEIESLNQAGVKIVIGPQTSSEAKQILPFADQNGMLVISQGSTSSALAIDDDALYRVVPTDQVEGKASADLIVTTNKGATIITMNRDDAGNSGLVQSVTKNAEAQGAKVVKGPVYPATGNDYEPIVKELATAVQNAPGDKKVVYLAGFGEVADILGLVSFQTELAEVPFFGGDGSAKSQAVLENKDAAKFAAGGGAGFPSPLPTLGGDTAKAPEALVAADEKAGVSPDALAYAAFDALQIALKANAAAGGTTDGAKLRTAFAEAAKNYKGISGVINLDAAGDREAMPFAFWNVCPKDSGFEWFDSGSWTPGSGSSPGTVDYSACETQKPKD